MALPKLLREIFENDGAGPKFRADKIPVTQVTVDSALSATSENPVQNKVVKAQMDTLQANIDEKLTEATLRTALTELITEYGGTVPTE